MTSVAIDRLDGLSSSTAIKGPCRVAATSDITLSGLQTIDGVTVAAEDRVLVKGQTTSSQNGIYVADTGPWRRAADFSRNRDLKCGAIVVVTEGALGAGSYRLATADPITLDTSSITFDRFASGYGATVRDYLDIAADGSTDDTAAVAAITGYPVIDCLGLEIKLTAWPRNVTLYNGTVTIGTDKIKLPDLPYLDPFPTPNLVPVPTPDGMQYNLYGAPWVKNDALTNGNNDFATTRIFYGRRNTHYAEEGSWIFVATTEDDGHNVKNVKPVYQYPGWDVGVWAAGTLNNNRYAIESTRRKTTGLYTDPVVIYTDDGETFTTVTLTRDPSLPSNFGALGHGPFYNRPARFGGDDDTWLFYCYSQRCIAYAQTEDNGVTWGNVLPCFTLSSPYLPSEMAVGRLENEAKAYMLMRDDGVNSPMGALRFSKSTDMLNWSDPVVTPIPLFSSPPFIIEHSANRHYLLGRSIRLNRQLVDYSGHLLMMEIDPQELYATDGQSGWKGWRVLANLPGWAIGYIYFQQRRSGSEWIGIINAAERPSSEFDYDNTTYPQRPGGLNTSHGGPSQLFFLSNNRSPAPSVQAALQTLPARDIGLNGLFQVCQLYPDNTTITGVTGSLTVADGWRLRRNNSATGHYAKLVTTDKGKALEIGRTAGNADTNIINLLTVLDEETLRPYRGRFLTVCMESMIGANFSGVSSVYYDLVVRMQTAETTITAADGSTTSDTVWVNGVDYKSSALTYCWNFQTFLVPDDAKMATIILRYEPSGTAGANDWIRFRCAAVIPGPLHRPVEQLDYADVLARCQRQIQKTWSAREITPTAGSLNEALAGPASGTTSGRAVMLPWKFDPPMRADPTVTIYSPTTATAGKMRDETAGADIDATTAKKGVNRVLIINNASVTDANLHSAHAIARSEFW